MKPRLLPGGRTLTEYFVSLRCSTVHSFPTPRLLTAHLQTELALHTHVAVSDVRQDVANTHGLVSDIHRAVVKGQEGTDIRNQGVCSHCAVFTVKSPLQLPRLKPGLQFQLWPSTHNLTFEPRILGESPPPPPRACFGRDDLIEKIVGLAENLTPIALIGAGGIGKTSIALSVLHDDCIKERFNENRRFIRCDQFQPARANLLNRLSKVIGAGIENPEDLTPLRPFLSSKEMLIVLDNAESILDPQGTDAQDIYAVVEELSRFENISLCITSRISTVPLHCNRLIIPTLSMESACDVFYGTHENSERSDIVRELVQQLDFHALSITLLATTAAHNMWDDNRLAKEWALRRGQVLRTDHNESLEATVELSLASPTFCNLGPIARELLGVIAFFPQGINEDNLDWLFPVISNRTGIVDKFCALSLTHRSNNFITMLAPLRDYLSPRDPRTSPLLCTIKDRYFSRLRLLGDLEPDQPGFRESLWITSEDVNAEHLLNVFMSYNTDSDDIWDTCANFMAHLAWHKPRPTVLAPRAEGLSDDHHFKPRCLLQLSRLFGSLGDHAERQRFLNHVLELERGRGDDDRVALTLRYLADANRMLHLYREGIRQSKEALEIYQRLDDAGGQAKCWNCLGRLLLDDGQLDAAEEAGSCAIDLFRDQRREYWVCNSHRLLGDIYESKGERGKAIRNLEAAIRIASPFNWHHQLFWAHFSLTVLFRNNNELDSAQSHIEQAKPYAVDNAHRLGRTMGQQAEIWYGQGLLEEAKAEMSCALEVFEKLGATAELQWYRYILREIEQAIECR